ncbi:hypothetical protein GCM10010967_13510 [Dyadobacter beijingensis]|uniref:Uncharacterized protein n=1 Tax=Dyadobacter beijingensis TaxID=365489 RepID=A0ABQ2HJ44_9BACT|nr:hypothetical protein [Dyadobacter beijingensis]GGM83111.1 hypothetical protein GCM10010967_13510 [Dyadobacter beijingensis]
MDLRFYENIPSGLGQIFWFKSEGRDTIYKAIIFRPTGDPDTFELVLGELNPDGSIDTIMRSNNGDSDRVLFTAAKAVAFFLSEYSDSYVVIEPNTTSRARLYRMVIDKELDDLGEYLNICAFDGHLFESFQRGKNYVRYVISVRFD